MEDSYSSIICVADMNITEALDQCLADISIPEVFIQRAKQMSLVERHRFPALRGSTRLDESRALIYRTYVPSEYAEGVMRRIAEVTDLKMGGRGCIFTQRIDMCRGAPLSFDTEKLERLCGKSRKIQEEEHTLVSCIIPRGSGNSLAQAVLELGVCVPIIFFGTGVGLRDKLGLMRITVPVEKEIIWFIVPRVDVELVEKTLIPRARLDVPGQGFLYKFSVHAPVVNLRVRQGKRVHAATMEQVIAALDEVQGSSDWRRLGTRKKEGGGNRTISTRGLFFIGEEDEVETFRRMAMDSGARGATLNSVEMRQYGASHAEAKESHSRELCDIITSPAVEKALREQIAGAGVFGGEKTCLLKSFEVEMAPVIRRHARGGQANGGHELKA